MLSLVLSQNGLMLQNSEGAIIFYSGVESMAFFQILI